MRRRPQSRRRSISDSDASLLENLSEGELKKKLRIDALVYPITVLALVLSILFLIFLIISPGIVFIVLLIIAAIAAAGSFFWRYSIRYNEEYAKRVAEVMERHNRETTAREQGELERLRDDLQTGFSSVNSVAGLKALQELVYEYEQLQPVIRRRAETDPLSVARVPGLAEETYRQGLGVLGGSLELMRAIHSPYTRKLEAELADLEKEVESLRGDETQAERLRVREETVASHKERLALIKDQQLRVDDLLRQSDGCEASLQKTRIELAALRADSSDVAAVTATLESAINHAKEVQQELKSLGY